MFGFIDCYGVSDDWMLMRKIWLIFGSSFPIISLHEPILDVKASWVDGKPIATHYCSNVKNSNILFGHHLGNHILCWSCCKTLFLVGGFKESRYTRRMGYTKISFGNFYGWVFAHSVENNFFFQVSKLCHLSKTNTWFGLSWELLMRRNFPLIGHPQNDWMILKLTNVLGGYTTNWLGLQKDLTALERRYFAVLKPIKPEENHSFGVQCRWLINCIYIYISISIYLFQLM